jgi:hypothetical protein
VSVCLCDASHASETTIHCHCDSGYPMPHPLGTSTLYTRRGVKTTRPAMCSAHGAVIVASLVGLLLNIEQMWLLEQGRHSAQQQAKIRPPPPPPAYFDGECTEHCTTWFVRPPAAKSGAPRVARVSASRQDAGLFRQLGLEVQELCTPALSAAFTATSKKGRRGATSTGNSADLLLLDWRTPGAGTLSRSCTGAATAAARIPRGSLNASAVDARQLALDAEVLWGGWTAHLQFL